MYRPRNLLAPTLIYKALCLVDGSFYIGVTMQSLEKRKEGHRVKALSRTLDGGYLYHRPFYVALRTHGIDKFEFSVLERYDNKAMALKHEAELIAELAPPLNSAKGEYKTRDKATGRKITYSPVSCKKHKKRRTQIKCLTDGKVFNTVREAAAFYFGLTEGQLQAHLCGSTKEAHGRRFITERC